jgi:bacteriorhodopsin
MMPKWHVDGFIVAAACAPVVGVVMAIYSREPAWLFLCFALSLFL